MDRFLTLCYGRIGCIVFGFALRLLSLFDLLIRINSILGAEHHVCFKLKFYQIFIKFIFLDFT